MRVSQSFNNPDLSFIRDVMENDRDRNEETETETNDRGGGRERERENIVEERRGGGDDGMRG